MRAVDLRPDGVEAYAEWEETHIIAKTNRSMSEADFDESR